MKRALPFNEQVDISSDASSSSDMDVHKVESDQISNNITIDKVVDDVLVSEGTKVICHHFDTVNCDYEEMSNNIYIGQGVEELDSKDALTRRAKMYQEYMQLVPIPTEARSTIPFKSWTGLADSVKQLYKQPLHYLTNVLMKQWDQMRIGADDDGDPVEYLIHPTKAEASIWLMEEVHRRTTSPDYLAKLWLADPMYHAYIDPIFPRLPNPSK